MKKAKDNPGCGSEGSASPAFLLSQVGAHAAIKYGERLAKLNVSPPHSAILRILAVNPGLTQQALANILGALPSRLVVLIDELEARKLIERRPHESDRRSYSLHLTEDGVQRLREVMTVGYEHQESLLSALSDQEREKLSEILQKIADQQGLIPNVHPSFNRTASEGNKKDN